MDNCSCNNKKYLREGCIELPSEFGGYFLVQNFFRELDTEEKRLIAQLNLGIDKNLTKISKLIPTDTSEENKLINQEQLNQAIQNEASERENAIRELDSKIPVFTNEQLETLNSGITSSDKTKLNNISTSKQLNELLKYNIIDKPVYININSVEEIQDFPVFPGIGILVNVLEIPVELPTENNILFQINLDSSHQILESYKIEKVGAFIIDLSEYKQDIGNGYFTKTLTITSILEENFKLLITPIYIL